MRPVVVMLWACAALACAGVGRATQTEVDTDHEALRALVREMKLSPKGPFEAVKWFCADGSILPPRSGACSERGGGIQHGVLSPRARRLREEGYAIANVLASLPAERFVGADADLEALRDLILERFLIRWDDGWIFRGARSYRGALQIEDEEAASERLMLALLADPAWLEDARFLLLRELARALPLPSKSDVAERMRSQAALIGDADPGFASLRARIHSFPEPADAGRVRRYAQSLPEPGPYQELAQTIDEFFARRAAADSLDALGPRIEGALFETPRAERAALRSRDPAIRLEASGRGLAAIRRRLARPELRPRGRLAALRASLALEAEAFAASQIVVAEASVSASRRERLLLLRPLASSLFGAGLLTERQLESVSSTIEQVTRADAPALGLWRAELSFLARAPEWCRRWLMFQLGPSLARFARIEEEVSLFDADRLRGSPLLAYGVLLDELLLDAQQLSGVADRVLGEAVGVGLRGLNPGIATGVLLEATSEAEIEALPRDAVALLPETTSHLPPVAAILTLGEGSSLSHVQLLARNLGIPNAVVSRAVAERLRAELGREIEVVVSRSGRVQIERVERSNASAEAPAVERERAIRIDASRLRLGVATPIELDAISAADSGRLCGPKAANLGELRKQFGDTVPDGFVLPFGVFRRVLERPIEADGPSAFEWLESSYRELERLGEPERAAETARVLARMREWISSQEPDRLLREEIEQRLSRLGRGGVFVRSDTNVEDLPGFSGAGLNLTVGNVVGIDAVMAAVVRVWASPFSDRAYAWRQAHMARPELVFPSILVQHAFAAEQSGVMVTVDIDTGDPGVLSVAVGEGVGGAVDGQAAESLRIERATGRVRQLSAATAPVVAELDPLGGIRQRPASGAASLLDRDEIDQLIALRDRIAALPAWGAAFDAGLAADVEFAFRDGRLALLQLRPLAESRRAMMDERLRAVDALWSATAERPVPLDEKPGEGAS